MNPIEAFVDRDHYDPDVIREFCSVVCGLLEIPEPKLILVNFPFLPWLPQWTCFFASYGPIDNPTVIMYQTDSLMLETSPLVILAHELKHAQQYHRKRIDVIGGKRCWDGVAYPYPSDEIEFEAQPWEADAIAFERMIASLLLTNATPRISDMREAS
jgi:hypothetical protein